MVYLYIILKHISAKIIKETKITFIYGIVVFFRGPPFGHEHEREREARREELTMLLPTTYYYYNRQILGRAPPGT